MGIEVVPPARVVRVCAIRGTSALGRQVREHEDLHRGAVVIGQLLATLLL